MQCVCVCVRACVCIYNICVYVCILCECNKQRNAAIITNGDIYITITTDSTVSAGVCACVVCLSPKILVNRMVSMAGFAFQICVCVNVTTENPST